MRYHTMLALTALFHVSAVGASATDACYASFNAEGSKASGTTYRVSTFVNSVDPTTAEKRLATALLAKGWANPQINSEFGAMTANVSGHPLNVLVSGVGAGVKIDAVQRIKPDTDAQEKWFQSAMCEVLASVGG